MINKHISLGLLLIALSLSACNSSSSTEPAKKPIAENPIPQAGGYSNITNEKLKELVAKGVPLIDIRRQEEWKQTGIIKGSKTITFFDGSGRINPNFVPELTSLVKPNEPVILICRTGHRSQAASQAIAQQLGYKKVFNVTHGITSWIAEKRPVISY